MKKALAKVAFVLSMTVMAVPGAQAGTTQQTVGCGLGTMIFENSTGLLYSFLAMTTNAFTFDTVSMTLGIGNCPAGASIRGKIASFIDFNKQQLAVEVAQGQGERLAALVEMFGVKESDRTAAISALKANQVAIFSQSSTAAIQDEMDKTLKVYVS
ncbi:MAG: hypothetical protein FD173_170 [Gallionellaceae bacterium]|nr:MAG: hypothetical protein FD173_170 [Gallionellaceae bacterium]